jgi:hypothetical protein
VGGDQRAKKKTESRGEGGRGRGSGRVSWCKEEAIQSCREDVEGVGVGGEFEEESYS